MSFEFFLFFISLITNLHNFIWCRSDVVEIETWCQGEGRIGTRRDWILKDYATGQVIGRATRCMISYCSVIDFYRKLKSKINAGVTNIILIPKSFIHTIICMNFYPICFLGLFILVTVTF